MNKMRNNSNFAVRFPSPSIDKRGEFKKALMNIILENHPHLSVAGLDEPEYDRFGRLIRSVEYAGPKNILGFGTSDDHDISFINRREDFLNNLNTPLYNLESDWNKVMSKLERFSKERETSECSGCPFASICKQTRAPKYNEAPSFDLSGIKVTVFGNFIKIGNTLVPRNLTPVFIMKAPVATRELIKRTIVTITRLA
jgi:hypothetical protein